MMLTPTNSDEDCRSFVEDEAIAYGSKWANIRRRLSSARAMLKEEYKVFFQPGEYWRGAKCLVGSNGYYLQWRVREFPDQPISYENQQTRIGSVGLYRKKEEE